MQPPPGPTNEWSRSTSAEIWCPKASVQPPPPPVWKLLSVRGSDFAVVHRAEGVGVHHLAEVHPRVHDVVVPCLHAVLDGAVHVGGRPWQDHPAIAFRLLQQPPNFVP